MGVLNDLDISHIERLQGRSLTKARVSPRLDKRLLGRITPRQMSRRITRRPGARRSALARRKRHLLEDRRRVSQLLTQQAAGSDGMLPLDIDPKLAWALKFRDRFPVDVNRAPREALLPVRFRLR